MAYNHPPEKSDPPEPQDQAEQKPYDPLERPPEVRRRQNRIFFASVIGFILLFVIISPYLGSSDDQPSSTGNRSSSSSASDQLDASGRVACRNYRGIFRDLDRGVLTDAEFRSRVQSANRNAEVSNDFALRSASEALLRSLTTGTAQQSADAVIAIHQRCEPVWQ